MRIDRPLDDALATRSHVRVLRALEALPVGFRASAREVARRAGISHPTASKVLAELAEQGVVLAHRGLRADAFELNRQHVLAGPLAALFEWEGRARQALVDFLRKEILQHAGKVEAAFLFGSAARGEMTAPSDIDVAVIVPRGSEEDVAAAMEQLAENVKRHFGNRVNTILSGSSAAARGRRGRGGRNLWRRIEREGLPLIGAPKARRTPA